MGTFAIFLAVQHLNPFPMPHECIILRLQTLTQPAIQTAGVWQHLGRDRKMRLPGFTSIASTEFSVAASSGAGGALDRRFCRITHKKPPCSPAHFLSLMATVSYKYSSNEFLLARVHLCCLQLRSLTETVMTKMIHRLCVP